MPYRRTRRTNYRSRQLRFRIGNIGAGGGRPINENTRTIKTVTASQFAVSATTAGDTGIFELTQFGTPASMPATTTFAERGTAANHPSEHPLMVTATWKTARVLSVMYRFDIRFVGTNSASKDFVFAYKFGTESTAAIVLTAGTPTIDNWKDMRQSRGWVWKRFSAINAGGSMYPSQGRVEVKVPSVMDLTKKMFEHVQLDLPWEDELEMTVSDAGNTSTVRPFLHIVIMTIDGTAFAAGDVVFDTTVFQKVKLSRGVLTADMIDEADQVT